MVEPTSRKFRKGYIKNDARSKKRFFANILCETSSLGLWTCAFTAINYVHYFCSEKLLIYYAHYIAAILRSASFALHPISLWIEEARVRRLNSKIKLCQMVWTYIHAKKAFFYTAIYRDWGCQKLKILSRLATARCNHQSAKPVLSFCRLSRLWMGYINH